MDIGSLARAAPPARRPDAVALEAPEERLTYRELLLAATRAAGGSSCAAPRRGDRVAIALPARARVRGRASTPACCCARPPCRSTRGSASASARRCCAAPRSSSARRCRATAACRSDAGAARRRDRAGRPHVGHDGRAAAGRAHLRQHRAPTRARSAPCSAARPRRALAVPDAALARRRADGAPALGRCWRRTVVLEPFDAERAARSCTRATSRSPRWCPTHARAHPRRRRPPRRRGCARILLGGGPVPRPRCCARARRRGLPGLPDLRADPGLLDGHARRARRPRDRRPRAARRRPRPSRRTARSSSPARPWWGSGTRCAPATSAASTTRAA